MLINGKIKILLIEDEEYDVKRIRRTLEPFKNNIVIEAVKADGLEAVQFLQRAKKSIDVVIMDYQIIGRLSGESLIRKIKEINPCIQIIVVTKMTVNIGDFDFANRLLKAGAMWYCTKYPGDIEEYIYQPTDFVLSILNAYEKKNIEESRRRSQKQLESNIQNILREKVIIGDSPIMHKLREQVNKAAKQEATVLIYGESGTGKELVANHIHYASKRRFERFVPINCGSLPSELIESELFGYEKGAFTGANAKKVGLFEIAHKGTIFLDEIGELPASAQVKLLRVLQEGEIDKIGRIEKIKVDVRVIAATNRDLEQAVQEHKFRQDLFYRLNVLTIRVPALREHKEDIPELLQHYLELYALKNNVTPPEIASDAMEVLLDYPWPGNIRQLQNVIQRLLFTGYDVIRREHLLNILKNKSALLQEKEPNVSFDIIPWREKEKEFKRKYFSFVRSHCQSDAEAARLLGLAPSNFYRMCKDLGIK